LWSSLIDFRGFKGFGIVDAFLLLKIIFCLDAFLRLMKIIIFLDLMN